MTLRVERRYTEVDFLDMGFKNEVYKYRSTHAISKDASEIFSRIQELYDGWYRELRESEENSRTLTQKTYCYKSLGGGQVLTDSDEMGEFYLDQSAFQMIQENFARKLRICSDRARYFANEESRSNILKPMTTNGHPFSFHCSWTNNHPILGSPREACPISLTAEGSDKLYQKAQQGIGTDITLLSNEGQSILFHSVVLNIPDINHLYSLNTLQNFQKLIYLGSSDAKMGDNSIEDILDLVDLACKIQHQPLVQYMCTVIEDYLNRKAFFPDELIQILHKAHMLNLTELYKPCLLKIEKLRDDIRLDLSDVHFAWLDLYSAACEIQDSLIKPKLAELIQDSIRFAAEHSQKIID